MSDIPKRNEILRFTVPKGTRKPYEEAARLAGKTPNDFYREALRQAVQEVFEANDVRKRLPRVHPSKPKRLQPRIKVRPSIRAKVQADVRAEDET